MKLNGQSIYQDSARAGWDGSQRFMCLLANQAPARMACFDTVNRNWLSPLVVITLAENVR